MHTAYFSRYKYGSMCVRERESEREREKERERKREKGKESARASVRASEMHTLYLVVCMHTSIHMEVCM